MLEDLHMVHRTLEQHFQRSADRFGQSDSTSDPRHG
jgi:hypothetical protein